MPVDGLMWQILEAVCELREERRKKEAADVGSEAFDDEYRVPGEEDTAIAERLKLPLQDVRDHLSVLIELGYLDAIPVREGIVNIRPSSLGRMEYQKRKSAEGVPRDARTYTETELQSIVLRKYYEKRGEGDFVSVNGKDFDGEVPVEDIYRVSEQLDGLGLIEFVPLRGDDRTNDGRGKITARGNDAIESAQPEEVRNQILAVMDKKGRRIDSGEIAQTLGLNDEGVRYHLDILERYGDVELFRAFGNDTNALLTASGRQRAREGYRHPREKSMPSGITLSISDSTVGVVNAGQIEDVNSIDVNIASLAQEGQTEISEALKYVAEAVATSQDIDANERSEFLDVIQQLSVQATLESQERLRKPVIKAMVSWIAAGVGAAGSLAEVWSTWGPAIQAHFGL